MPRRQVQSSESRVHDTLPEPGVANKTPGIVQPEHDRRVTDHSNRPDTRASLVLHALSGLLPRSDTAGGSKSPLPVVGPRDVSVGVHAPRPRVRSTPPHPTAPTFNDKSLDQDSGRG